MRLLWCNIAIISCLIYRAFACFRVPVVGNAGTVTRRIFSQVVVTAPLRTTTTTTTTTTTPPCCVPTIPHALQNKWFLDATATFSDVCTATLSCPVGVLIGILADGTAVQPVTNPPMCMNNLFTDGAGTVYTAFVCKACTGCAFTDFNPADTANCMADTGVTCMGGTIFPTPPLVVSPDPLIDGCEIADVDCPIVIPPLIKVFYFHLTNGGSITCELNSVDCTTQPFCANGMTMVVSGLTPLKISSFMDGFACFTRMP